MKIKITMENRFLKQYFLTCCMLVLAALLSQSCKKDNEELLPDGVSTYVKDLEGDILASMSETPGKELRSFYPLLFSFSDGSSHLIKNQAERDTYFKTNKWDLAFTGPYNSEIFLNNANDQFNPGYQGPVTNTAVVMLEQAYDSVNNAPSDASFNSSEVTKIGWASSASSAGWFFYSLNNHICVPIKNRTYVLRLPNGKYAKLEVQNIYKGNPAVVTDLFWPAPYISFRYYVQQDGSKNLNTKS